MTRFLSASDELIERPKGTATQKQKNESTIKSKTKYNKQPLKDKPKHSQSGRYDIKAEVMRKSFMAKISLPLKSSFHENDQSLEGKTFSLRAWNTALAKVLIFVIYMSFQHQ